MLIEAEFLAKSQHHQKETGDLPHGRYALMGHHWNPGTAPIPPAIRPDPSHLYVDGRRHSLLGQVINLRTTNIKFSGEDKSLFQLRTATHC